MFSKLLRSKVKIKEKNIYMMLLYVSLIIDNKILHKKISSSMNLSEI